MTTAELLLQDFDIEIAMTRRILERVPATDNPGIQVSRQVHASRQARHARRHPAHLRQDDPHHPRHEHGRPSATSGPTRPSPHATTPSPPSTPPPKTAAPLSPHCLTPHWPNPGSSPSATTSSPTKPARSPTGTCASTTSSTTAPNSASTFASTTSPSPASTAPRPTSHSAPKPHRPPVRLVFHPYWRKRCDRPHSLPCFAVPCPPALAAAQAPAAGRNLHCSIPAGYRANRMPTRGFHRRRFCQGREPFTRPSSLAPQPSAAANYQGTVPRSARAEQASRSSCHCATCQRDPARNRAGAARRRLLPLWKSRRRQLCLQQSRQPRSLRGARAVRSWPHRRPHLPSLRSRPTSSPLPTCWLQRTPRSPPRCLAAQGPMQHLAGLRTFLASNPVVTPELHQRLTDDLEILDQHKSCTVTQTFNSAKLTLDPVMFDGVYERTWGLKECASTTPTLRCSSFDSSASGIVLNQKGSPNAPAFTRLPPSLPHRTHPTSPWPTA